MTPRTTYLDVRGAFRALTTDGTSLFLLTEHPEGHPTGVAVIDPEKGTATVATGPGGRFLVGSDLVGTTPLARTATGIARADGPVLTHGDETVELPAVITALSADPTGTTLVVGCKDGTVAVFTLADGKLVAGDSGRIHHGEVTVFAWEPDEPRFWSAGTDNRLLVTDARGVLEPMDRTGKGGHDAPVRAMVVLGDHLVTGGDDGDLKVWERRSRRRPSTARKVGKACGLAAIDVDGTPHLAVATTSDTLKLLVFEKGKVGDTTRVFHGALAKAKRDLAGDPTARKTALDTLAGWDDQAAIELIADVARTGDDHKLRMHALAALGAAENPRSVPPLLQLLADDVDTIRMAAFTAVRKRMDTLRPLEDALETGYPDIGVRAVEALGERSDDAAVDLLLGALDHRAEPVRAAVLTALESKHPDGPEATRLAMRSRHADTRRQALIRLHQRDLLAHDATAAILRAATEDDDAAVRHTAYPLRLLAHPILTDLLRAADPDLHRQIHELENLGVARPKKPTKPKKAKGTPETLSPLLQAAASRQADVSTRGASHLAMLGDPRALGVLLQLSRDGRTDIRGRACKALATLGDARALSRLRAMLRDDESAVRDAAFSAVATLLAKEPLAAVEAGFVASAVDVRARALALLVKTLTKKDTKAGRALLLRALDDEDAGLRGNAFKAALRLSDAPDALAFVLGSLRADVRRMALTEVMAQIRHPWAYPLLLQLFDDPDVTLRQEAFGFARKKAKGRRPDALVEALGSRHADLRLQAVEVLAKKVDAAAVERLAAALDDDEGTVRTAALTALQRAGATGAIVGALDSSHADVRITAAATLAGRGDARALDALLAQVRSPEPEVADLAAIWVEHTQAALDGLAALGDPAATDAIVALLDHAKLGQRAAGALLWVADPDTLATQMKAASTHARTLAVGLAWRGDTRGSGLVWGGRLDPFDAVAAALATDDDERLLALLDDRDAGPIAMRALVLTSWVDAAFPERLLMALSAAEPGARLLAAGLLAAWNDPTTLDARVVEAVAHERLPVPLETLRRLALGLQGADGMARVSHVRLLAQLDARPRKAADQARAIAQLDHDLEALRARFPGLADLAPPDERVPADVDAMVFGTLTALAGQVAGRRGVQIRAMALRRLAALDGDLEDVLLPALQDPSAAVRRVAFELLDDHPRLAEEALATGHRDLGVLALEKLASTGGQEVLMDVLLTRNDRLAWTAWIQLLRSEPTVDQITAALDARMPDVRVSAVRTLAERHATDPGPLHAALEHAQDDVVRQAAYELGTRQDPRGIPELIRRLRDPDFAHPALEALSETRSVEVANALLDRITDDPDGTAETYELLDAVGDLRLAEVADRVASLVERPRTARHALDALTTISGYDQPLRWDPEQPDADPSWLDGQHPRHDAVLAMVLDLAATRNDQVRLRRLWRSAAWAPTATGEPLARMLDHADAAIRHPATEAYGWRLRFRDDDPAPLVRLLSHADGETAFLAAEGLARAGRADGLSVLLASIDTLADLRLRHRAVLALGHLADPRALDPLLAIADDPEHALVESAAEALGHLATSDRTEAVQERLLALVDRSGNVGRQALTGLRHLGTPTAWRRIREASGSQDGWLKLRAVELLQFDPEDPAALFRRLLLEDAHPRVLDTARTAWRRRVGPDSVEPDYTVVLSALGHDDDDLLERLRDRGEPDRLLEVATDPRATEATVGALLLTLAEAKLPEKTLLAGLASPLERAVAVAARLLGRRAKLGKAARSALEARAHDVRTPPADEGLTAYALEPVFWACAIHGIPSPLIAALSHPDVAVRRVAGSAARASTDPALLEVVVRQGTAADRTLATRGLAPATPLLVEVLDDPTATDGILQRGGTVPTDAIQSTHRQGVVLPHAVRRGELGALQEALSATEATVRLGALEGLGMLGQVAAEDVLAAFGRDEAREEEERKVAWRSLRRSRRIRGGGA
jgi:ParB family chromosome partitioning protein